MSARRTLDVSELPAITVDSRALMWWGIVLMVAIEGTMLVMAAAAYLYLGAKAPHWPPLRVNFPEVGLPTVTMVVLLLSIVPAVWLDHAAKRNDRRWMMLGFVGNLGLAVVAIALRAAEFARLPFLWNSHAYGSSIWAILSLHTIHLVASTVEGFVLFVLFLTRPLEKKHLLDFRIDGLYWYFVVAAWVPLYVMVFLSPRFR